MLLLLHHHHRSAHPLQLPMLTNSLASYRIPHFPPSSTLVCTAPSWHMGSIARICVAKSYGGCSKIRHSRTETEVGAGDLEDDEELDGPRRRFRKQVGQEADYDRDPEFAEIIGNCIDDPEKGRAKIEDRLRKKRNKILHTKTGSAAPMKVVFNKFEFSNSYIWLEFYNAPLEKDVALICDTIHAWHIVGRLGGCNSMNMQLSQADLDKRPSYDAIQGANTEPTTFYNVGDLEIQENLARIWVDIGTREPLLLDVLINALTQISSDYVGIRQVVFGGSEYETWKEKLTCEDAGYSVHRI